MQITTLAKEVQPYVVEMRRYFHQHPELSNREDKTIQRIAQELTDMDIPYEEIPKGGILATIQGLDPRKGENRVAAGGHRCPAGARAALQPIPAPGLPKPGGRGDARLWPRRPHRHAVGSR